MLRKENVFRPKVDRKLTVEKKKYFLGNVSLCDFSSALNIKEQKVYFVTFRSGARTKLHYHEFGQILITSEGKGVLCMYKKKDGNANKILKIKRITKIPLNKGDIAYVPSNTLHWHGGMKKNVKFSHISINSFTRGGKEAKTFWFDSDFESYAKRI